MTTMMKTEVTIVIGIIVAFILPFFHDLTPENKSCILADALLLVICICEMVPTKVVENDVLIEKLKAHRDFNKWWKEQNKW